MSEDQYVEKGLGGGWQDGGDAGTTRRALAASARREEGQDMRYRSGMSGVSDASGTFI